MGFCGAGLLKKSSRPNPSTGTSRSAVLAGGAARGPDPRTVLPCAGSLHSQVHQHWLSRRPAGRLHTQLWGHRLGPKSQLCLLKSHSLLSKCEVFSSAERGHKACRALGTFPHFARAQIYPMPSVGEKYTYLSLSCPVIFQLDYR